MLAGWFRIARPDVITGSIAASAPVRMIVSPLQRSLSCRKSSSIPTTVAQQASADTSNYKGGWEAIGRGMSKAGGATDNCFTNFRSVHQLAQFRECHRAVVSTHPVWSDVVCVCRLSTVGESEYGMEVLNKAARRCEGHEWKTAEQLLSWG